MNCTVAVITYFWDTHLSEFILFVIVILILTVIKYCYLIIPFTFFVLGTIYEGTRNIQLNTIAKLLEKSAGEQMM